MKYYYVYTTYTNFMIIRTRKFDEQSSENPLKFK